MPGPIEELAQQFLENPVRVAAEEGESRVEQIDQSVMWIDQANKLEYLPQLIKDRGMYRVLVFTRTKHRARKVAKILSRHDLDSDSIHGDKSQSARQRALKQFADGKIHVLVATDVASRGIDVDDVTHVVNFEIPNEPETYVHRIGRTGRAGNEGVAISLCDTTEMPYVSSIEKLLGSSIRVDKDQPFHAERVVKQPRGGGPKRGGQRSGRSGGSPGGGSAPSRGGASAGRGSGSRGNATSSGRGGSNRGGSRRGGNRRRRGGSSSRG
jgi:ATP-dependent RNA helicase RhlE